MKKFDMHEQQLNLPLSITSENISDRSLFCNFYHLALINISLCREF